MTLPCDPAPRDGGRERPILFSPPMVRALLEGKKTQTRRPVNDDKLRRLASSAGGLDSEEQHCRHGVPGDRLWVKEGWQPSIAHACGQDACECAAVNVHYLADKSMRFFPEDLVPDAWTMPKAARTGKGVTSLYTPRWASRITLEITEVRIQRVGDISEEDAKAEGMVFHDGRPSGHHGWRHDPGYGFVEGTPRGAFFALWRLINGDDSLKSNPWVWAISFKVVTP